MHGRICSKKERVAEEEEEEGNARSSSNQFFNLPSLFIPSTRRSPRPSRTTAHSFAVSPRLSLSLLISPTSFPACPPRSRGRFHTSIPVLRLPPCCLSAILVQLSLASSRYLRPSCPECLFLSSASSSSPSRASNRSVLLPYPIPPTRAPTQGRCVRALLAPLAPCRSVPLTPRSR